MHYTNDYCFANKLGVCQPKTGYRFSVDAVLLGRWVRYKKNARVLDLGCGSGVIALMLAYLYHDMRVTGVEIQSVLAHFAAQNAVTNNLANLKIIQGDARAIKPDDLGAPFDIIVSNPPYFKHRSGKINLDNGEALARHEINLNLKQLAQTARSLLTTRGKFYVIYPAVRLGELFYEFSAAKLTPKRLRCVHSREGEAACLVLVESSFQSNHGIKIEPPLYIYNNTGDYTSEVMAMYVAD